MMNRLELPIVLVGLVVLALAVGYFWGAVL